MRWLQESTAACGVSCKLGILTRNKDIRSENQGDGRAVLQRRRKPISRE